MRYFRTMSIEEIHEAVMQLPEGQRARLANDLLASLPAVLFDDDGGVAEAKRRSKELDENPDAGCSWGEIKRNLGR